MPRVNERSSGRQFHLGWVRDDAFAAVTRLAELHHENRSGFVKKCLSEAFLRQGQPIPGGLSGDRRTWYTVVGPDGVGDPCNVSISTTLKAAQMIQFAMTRETNGTPFHILTSIDGLSWTPV